MVGQERTSATADGAENDGAKSPQYRLRSLSPSYDEAHHAIYVEHLEAAVLEKKNLNIALTGRYGTGKSSVLDQFERDHADKTVRISINTLGPDEDDDDLTNRIQKELLKQLVYRLKPGEIRRSRFARPVPLTKWRAARQAAAVSAVGVGLLWLAGVRPADGWPGAQTATWVQFLLGILFFGLLILAVWMVRLVIGDRIVNEVTTAGTRIALGEGPTTYFDSYLDEIVAFFDAVEPHYVIFEDLDRFDDPQIFDSLRELNTLINKSAHWKGKDQPVRFIYAIKDSLFEQLGDESTPKHPPTPEGEPTDDVVPTSKDRVDVAEAAARRANRTKFFELVIPIVPFISHRNARDHLVEVLASHGLDKGMVSRPLLDLVARHTTDMRLMINICNEFVVFCQRLLWDENPAPGMTPDHLFALVVYKNFHLSDFEAISQATSTLDQLERRHRDLVRSVIQDLQARKREGLRTEEHRQRRDQTAQTLGARLRDLKDVWSVTGRQVRSFVVGETEYLPDAVDTAEFWEHVAQEQALTFASAQTRLGTVSQAQISSIFPEVADAGHWGDPDPEELAGLVRGYDADIAFVRGADFAELARYPRIPRDQTGLDTHIHDLLGSELARDLVRAGFITRNYAEYSSVFYGNFAGVDVAFFYNHSVQPNVMYVDYQFTSPNAVNNLLEQAPSDFTSSLSALNIQVVSHLLKAEPEKAEEVVGYVVDHDHKEDVHRFLEAFLNDPQAPRDLLVRRLAEHPWPRAFTYLVEGAELPDEETRNELFDVALQNMREAGAYEVSDKTIAMLKSSFPQLAAVTKAQPAEQAERIFGLVETADLIVDSLADVGEPLRGLLVAAHRYEMNVPNLRLALGIEGAPTLDEVRQNEHVWEYCKARVSEYVTTMDSLEPPVPVIGTESVLVDVLNEQHESWTEDEMSHVITRSARAAAVADLQEVPGAVWPSLADSHLIKPTLANAADYAQSHGVDAPLAAILTPDDGAPIELLAVSSVDEEDKEAFAIDVLNAGEHLPASARTQIVTQLHLSSQVDLAAIEPQPDQLLARAIEARLIPDAVESFVHFAPAGWAAISEAFLVSEHVSDLMDPALLQPFVAEFLADETIQDSYKRTVVEGSAEYVVEDDERALRAVGVFAHDNKIWLSLGEIRRIARVTQDPELVLAQLVKNKDAGPDDWLNILASLGTPYDTLTKGVGHEFDLPADSSSQTLLRRLEDAGRVEIVERTFGRGRKVRNLC